MVGKRQSGATLLSVSISGGYGNFDTDRALVGGARANGNQDLWLMARRLRAEYAFEWTDWHIKPRGDLGIAYVSSNSFNYKPGGVVRQPVPVRPIS